ncbi:MAG TPA: transglutaminase domain-containing protein, partial [Pyrinomonadaceae bacterium]|nr:transglutaminase domain-containing protein [Pyrinomonadaceae bacterium]
FKIESLARVWPFLNKENQIKILGEILEQKLIPTPPPIAVPSPKARTSGRQRTRDVTVTSMVLAPGVTALQATDTFDTSRHLNALTLLRDLPVADLKLPFAKLLAAKSDTLTTLALQIASERDESLPAAELLKLLPSFNGDIRIFAAWHLGDSGSVRDIKTIEGYFSNPPTVAVANADRTIDSSALFKDELHRTIRKIRFREQLVTASGDSRRELIKTGLADPQIAEWVWYRFVLEKVAAGQNSKATVDPQRPLQVLPLGQNLFPQDVALYAALPQPAVAFGKLTGAFDGLQLESARSQANLVLILSVLREQLAQLLDSPPGASPMTYSGINTNEPIALASWSAAGAPIGVRSAERQAIIVRVSDRARFERLLALYQRNIGNFKGLTSTFSGGLRFLTFLPAFLPITARAMLDSSVPPTKQPLTKYTFVTAIEWNGYPIKVIEQRRIESSGRMTTDAAYLTYLGDTAVLAPDLFSLSDVLTRASSQQPSLASNRDFKRLMENPGQNSGEAIYLSNISRLIAEPGTSEDSNKDAVTESGALRISNPSIESLYRVEFNRSESLKSLVPFHPEALSAPRELLPRSTIAYYFMNIDGVMGWQDWANPVFSAERRKDLISIWAIDFEKEVLPELGPECGLAVLGLPDIFKDNWNIPWVAFARLKSDKLKQAFASGKLLSASGGPGPIHLKQKSGDLYVALNGNFLVVSNTLAAMDALNQKEKLIASRDFARGAKRAPANVVAFGGYSLEAAIAAIGDSGSDPMKTQQSALITSLTNAFHSPNFYATATPESLEGRFAISMDREGRFSVSELSSLSKEYALTYAQVETHGVPIQNQERLNSLKLRIRATAAGEIVRIKEDVTSTHQTALKLSDTELELKILPRKSEPKARLLLPIKRADLEPYLQPGREIRSDDKSVIEKARSIAGEERDAWKIAGKLADWTYKNITWKRVDNATAAQTLATLEADCLEFSQLFVAMARSLGLPARLVSGLAYSGASFGGHAWVEVYVGEWIELDPTWGTNFVDATHIRNSANGTLLTYASLNLIQLEVLEAPRGEAAFQKDPRSLVEMLSQELPKGSLTALTSALDLAVLTEENGRLGTWDSLSDPERQAMAGAYRRVLLEISVGYQKEKTEERDLHVLQVKENGDRAEAVVIDSQFDSLLKFRFVRRNGAWFLTELHQTDSDLRVITETLQPAIRTILARRNNKAARGQSVSEFVRALVVMQKDPQAAVAILDRALKEDPKSRGFRHLKALALARIDKAAEAIQLWNELAAEVNPFAPAVLSLARQYEYAEEKEKQKLAIEFYTRYGVLEPADPRTHSSLARLYERGGDDVRAEVEYRAAIKADPSETGYRLNLAAFLALRNRFTEAGVVIDEAEKKAKAGEDPFGDLMMQLYLTEDKETIPEELALRQPQRMGRSYQANLYLAYAFLDNAKALQAILPLKKAAALKKDSSEPYEALARGYRLLHNWSAALTAADTSIKLNSESSDGYLNRACALARLGRIQDALKALEKAVELDPDLSSIIEEEADLKNLAATSRFKKLVATEEEKQ